MQSQFKFSLLTFSILFWELLRMGIVSQSAFGRQVVCPLSSSESFKARRTMWDLGRAHSLASNFKELGSASATLVTYWLCCPHFSDRIPIGTCFTLKKCDDNIDMREIASVKRIWKSWNYHWIATYPPGSSSISPLKMCVNCKPLFYFN